MDVAICEMKKLCNDTQNVLTENYFISTLQYFIPSMGPVPGYLQIKKSGQPFSAIQELSQSRIVER